MEKARLKRNQLNLVAVERPFVIFQVMNFGHLSDNRGIWLEDSMLRLGQDDL